jgi:hypothetical protein
MRFPYPSREPTPSEYAVLVVFTAAVFIIIGVVALTMAFRVPAEKHELAVALAHRGLWSLGIGVAIIVAYWLFRRLRDY